MMESAVKAESRFGRGRRAALPFSIAAGRTLGLGSRLTPPQRIPLHPQRLVILRPSPSPFFLSHTPFG